MRTFLPFSSLLQLLIRIVPAILISALLQGCSIGGFLGAYFNTYYNAQRLFSEAEDEVLAQQKSRKGPQEFLAPFAIPQTTRTKLTSVIEKCSKVLQDHAETSLVDDALLMVGKAYYYQDENQKAERKFRELIEGYPQSDLIYEARLLLVYVGYRMNQKPEAMAAAKDLAQAAREEEKNDVVARASLVMAQIELDNKNPAEAILHYQAAAENAAEAEDRVSAYIKVAEVYEGQEQYQKAAEAYLHAEGMSTDYLSEYRSRYGEARMLSRLGKHGEALDALDVLRSNSNNREFFGEIDLETGNVYNRMGDLAEAIAQYQYVDTAYARTEASARSYYELGRLYETKLMRYDSAAAVYSKGKTEYPAALVQPLLVRRSEIMTRYTMLWYQLGRFDSLRAEHLRSRDSVAIIKDSTQSDSLMSHGLPADSVRVRAPIIPLDSINAVRARTIVELASLLFADIGATDSARMWFTAFLDEFPDHPAAPRALFMLAQIAGQDTLGGAAVADSLYRALVARYPASDFAAEAARLQNLPFAQRRGDQANQTYGRGEDLLEAGNGSAAIDTFKVLARSHPDSPLASKAQYAVGWIYEEMLSDRDSAIAYYQALVATYPTSEYAAQVRPKLAEVELQLKQEREAARQDSLKRAAPPPENKESPGVTVTPDTSRAIPDTPDGLQPPEAPASGDTSDVNLKPRQRPQ